MNVASECRVAALIDAAASFGRVQSAALRRLCTCRGGKRGLREEPCVVFSTSLRSTDSSGQPKLVRPARIGRAPRSKENRQLAVWISARSAQEIDHNHSATLLILFG
ncbi:hypothetical protein SKAU_G00086440 [Synaphobranchus kaupii]|uniref:Uncharacterized protein n=1 Tax=Synaphobranchus kaupii TaxID=118154 RepID=A0A9Q1FWP7_SYNKA|nr:hypothetical protein SKAU_G00086440 [Synaphobranchus kaupii]